jgi:hypothetical protein
MVAGGLTSKVTVIGSEADFEGPPADGRENMLRHSLHAKLIRNCLFARQAMAERR